MTRAILKPGRERSARQGHPWIFSGAIARLNGSPAPGELVEVRAADGSFVGLAAFSPASQIRLRLWTTTPGLAVDEAFLQARLAAAVAARQRLGLLRPDGGCRLVHGEADGLPGLIVDHYAGYLAVQFLAAGVEALREVILDALTSLLAPAGILERSAASARRLEGLASRQGPLRGSPPPPELAVRSGELWLLADLAHGQKTGAYLDQQANHWRVARHAADARVLDVFAHTGGFGLAALIRGARRATLVESSADTLALARRQAERNGLAADCEFVAANAFDYLRELAAAGANFDLVILDPPKFVHNAGQLKRGARAYKDINRLAMGLLADGGLLASFSCSGNVSRELFHKILAGAARDAGCQANLVAGLGQPADHPVALQIPETEYLTGALVQVRRPDQP